MARLSRENTTDAESSVDKPENPVKTTTQTPKSSLLGNVIALLVVVALPIVGYFVLGAPRFALPSEWTVVQNRIASGTLPAGNVIDIVSGVLAVAWVAALISLVVSVIRQRREGRQKGDRRKRGGDRRGTADPFAAQQETAGDASDLPWYRQGPPIFDAPISDFGPQQHVSSLDTSPATGIDTSPTNVTEVAQAIPGNVTTETRTRPSEPAEGDFALGGIGETHYSGGDSYVGTSDAATRPESYVDIAAGVPEQDNFGVSTGISTANAESTPRHTPGTQATATLSEGLHATDFGAVEPPLSGAQPASREIAASQHSEMGPAADLPELIPVRAYYISRNEDTLRSISAQFLNSPRRWEELRTLNSAHPDIKTLGPDDLVPLGSALMLPGDPVTWGNPDPVHLWTLVERLLYTTWGREPAPSEVEPFWRALAHGGAIEAPSLPGLEGRQGYAESPPLPSPEPAAEQEAPTVKPPPEEMQPREAYTQVDSGLPPSMPPEPQVPAEEPAVTEPDGASLLDPSAPTATEATPSEQWDVTEAAYETHITDEIVATPSSEQPTAPEAPTAPTAHVGEQTLAYKPPEAPVAEEIPAAPAASETQTTFASPPLYEPAAPSAPPDAEPPYEPPPLVEEDRVEDDGEKQKDPSLPKFMPSMTGADASTRISEQTLVSSRRSVAGTAIGDAMMLLQLSRLRRRKGRQTPLEVNPLEESLKQSAQMESLRLIEAAMRHLRIVTVAQLRKKPKVVAVRVGAYGFEVLLDQPVDPPELWVAASGGYVLELADGVTIDHLNAYGRGPSLCPALVPVGETKEGPLLLNFEEISSLAVSGPDDRSASLLSAIVRALGSSPMAENVRVIAVGLETPSGTGWERVFATSFDSPHLEQLLLRAAKPEAAGTGEEIDVLVVGPGHDLLIQRAGQIAVTPGTNLSLVGATSSAAARWPWRIHIDATSRAVVQPIAFAMAAAQSVAPGADTALIPAGIGKLDN